MPINRESLAAVMEKAVAAACSDPKVSAAARMTVAGLKFLADHIDALEARLEASPFHYDGPHENGKAYERGTFVSYAGSLWHCNRSTTSKPGDGSAWTLAVKRGRDGKDAE